MFLRTLELFKNEPTKREEVSKILNLPKNERAIVIVPVGFPKEVPPPPEREPEENLIKEIK